MFQQNTGDSDGDILIAYVAVRFGNTTAQGNHVIKSLERLYELRDLLQIKSYNREPKITLEGFPAFPKTAF
jgi:hypothetical protein